jgi:hypothetical protein
MRPDDRTRSIEVSDIRRKGVTRYWVLGAILLLSTLAFFGPTLMSLGWYLLHKHEVRFRGVTLTVPIGWRLEAEDGMPEEVTLRKVPLSVFQNGYYQTMTFSRLPAGWGPPPRAYENWKDFVALTLRPGYWSDVREDKIGVASQQASCTSAHPKEDSKAAHATCILVQAGMRADFNGASHDMTTFFNVIRNLH